MTCTIPRPAPADLFERIKNQFSANVLKGGKVIPESVEHYVVANDYLAAETFYSIAEQQWRERDPRYACCDNLVKMAADRGVYPRAASFARGFVTITGTPGTALPPNLQFRFGTAYYRSDIAMTVPSVIAANGAATVPIIAEEPGSAGNDLSSSTATGTLVTSVVNVETTATACGGAFCNGRDAEGCEEFRTRYLQRLSYKPVGKLDWAMEKLVEFPCLTRVCLRNCNCCDPMPELQMYPFFDGTFPYGIPPASVVADLKAWFFGVPQNIGAGQAPFGVRGDFFIPTTAAVDVKINGLECVRIEQVQTVKERIASLFAGLCPSARLYLRQFDVVIAQVIGATIPYDVHLSIAAGATGLTLDDCGDIIADCDVLPVLGTIEIKTNDECA